MNKNIILLFSICFTVSIIVVVMFALGYIPDDKPPCVYEIKKMYDSLPKNFTGNNTLTITFDEEFTEEEFKKFAMDCYRQESEKGN